MCLSGTWFHIQTLSKYILCNVGCYFRYVHVINRKYKTRLASTRSFTNLRSVMPHYCGRPSVWTQNSNCVGPPSLLRQNKCDKCGKTARRNKNLQRHRQMCTAHLAPPTRCAAVQKCTLKKLHTKKLHIKQSKSKRLHRNKKTGQEKTVKSPALPQNKKKEKIFGFFITFGDFGGPSMVTL